MSLPWDAPLVLDMPGAEQGVAIAMKRTTLTLALLVTGILAGTTPAAANQRFIVRSTSLPILQKACLLNLCDVVQNLDGQLNQVFLLEFPNSLPVNTILGILRAIPGVVDAEVDALQTLALGQVPANGTPAGLNDRSPVQFYGTTVWEGYALQPATSEIRLPDARAFFHVTGAAV